VIFMAAVPMLILSFVVLIRKKMPFGEDSKLSRRAET
jgi:hypothetical protein